MNLLALFTFVILRTGNVHYIKLNVYLDEQGRGH